MEEKVREGERQKQESEECYPAPRAGTEQVEKRYVPENGMDMGLCIFKLCMFKFCRKSKILVLSSPFRVVAHAS